MKNELKEMIAKIKRALGKIEKKTYGICENCGKDIDKSRLEVLPVAPLCYECEKRKL